MFCPKCGKELPPGAGFCPNCGTPTGESAPQRTPTSSKSSSSIGRSMEDVVGKNSAYYLTEFQKIEEKQKSRFNWAALLLGPAMCFYRKCGGPFPKYFLIPLVLFLGGYLFTAIGTGIFHPTLMLVGTGLSVVSGIWLLVAYICFGLKFNREYYAVCKKKLGSSAGEQSLGVTLKSLILFVVVWVAAVAVCMGIAMVVVNSFWNSALSDVDSDAQFQYSDQDVTSDAGVGAGLPIGTDGSQINSGLESQHKTDPTYGKIPVSDDGYIYVNGNPFNPYEFNEAARDMLEQVHLDSSGVFVDSFGSEDMETNVLYNDWVSNQTVGYGYTDYVLLTAFCTITGIDSSEYEEAMATVGYASDPGDYYNDDNITFKPGDEINSYFSITGYGQFATVMQYIDCIPDMEEQFHYWVEMYADPNWSEYETCAAFASEFGITFDM